MFSTLTPDRAAPTLKSALKFAKHATEHGRYWTSSAGTEALRRTLPFAAGTEKSAWWEDRNRVRGYLKDLKPGQFAKDAAIGGEPSQGFEESLSALAYNYIKDKAPRLLDFLIGFQLVDRNEDNTKAFAIFGFKAGDLWLYCPIFFLTGDVKGHELLYIKNQDLFVPLKENWVSNLIAQRPHILGEPTPLDAQGMGARMPNVTDLVQMRTAKRGADWLGGFLPLAAAAREKRATALHPGMAGTLDIAAVAADPFAWALAPLRGQFDIGKLCQASDEAFIAGNEICKNYPAIRQALRLPDGREFFDVVAEQRKEAAAMAFAPERTKKAEATAPIAVQVITKADEVPAGATSVEREKLARDGVLVVDNRADGEKSEVFDGDGDLPLTSPHISGAYTLFLKDGKFKDVFILRGPYTGGGQESYALVVERSGDTKAWGNYHPSGLLVHANSGSEFGIGAWADEIKSLSEVGTLSTDSRYALVTPDGRATAAFDVDEDLGGGTYHVNWRDYGGYEYKGYFSREPTSSLGNRFYGSHNDMLQIGGSGRIHARNGTVYVPADAKVIRLEKTDRYEGQKSKGAPTPGDLDDLQAVLLKTAEAVEIRSTKGAYSVKGQEMPLTKTAALKHFVLERGLTEEATLAILKKADDAASRGKLQPVKVYIKQASVWPAIGGAALGVAGAKAVRPWDWQKGVALGLGLTGGGLMGYGIGRSRAPDTLVLNVHEILDKAEDAQNPDENKPAVKAASGIEFPDQQTGTETFGPREYPAIYGDRQEEFPIQSMQPNQFDPAMNDPFYRSDDQAMRTAQQAAASGQKDVLDTSMFSGLLKSVRQDSIIDRHLGPLLTALDRLGRLLFLAYWHGEEFQERFGKQDMPELFDSLRNTFESLGDVVLFLKEKTVQSLSGVDFGAGVGNTSAPNIDEVARN